MSRTAAEILEEARQLPSAEIDWLIQSLADEGGGEMSEEAFAAWQREAGEPEPGYDDWFGKGVEESLADPSSDIPHEHVAQEVASTLRSLREAELRKTGA